MKTLWELIFQYGLGAIIVSSIFLLIYFLVILFPKQPLNKKSLLNYRQFWEYPPFTSWEPAELKVYMDKKENIERAEQKKSEIKRQADQVWNTDFYNNGFNVI